MNNPAFKRLRDRLLSALILLRGLPAYLPFLPLIGRRALGGTSRPRPPAPASVPGSLSAAEREWLAAQARQTPANGVIVQSGSLETDATCALATGCWASRRRVYALLPPGVGDEAVREWHRALIHNGLAPYVTPVAEAGEIGAAVDLLYANETEAWAGRLKPTSVVVRRAEANELKGCGRLTARPAGYLSKP